MALCLLVQILLQRKPVLIKEIRLNRTQCRRSQRYEVRTPLSHTVGKGFVVEDHIGKARSESFVGVDLSRADIPLERPRPADDPTEVIEPTEITGDADPQVGCRDPRPPRHQSQITGGRESGSHPRACAVHCRHTDLWQACKDPDGVSSRSQLRDPGCSAQCRSAPDVCAGAKGVPRACEHQDAYVASFSDLA